MSDGGLTRTEIHPRGLGAILVGDDPGTMAYRSRPIGDGAVIDTQFNTTDVCILVKTDLVTEKYSRHYERLSKDPWAT